MKIKSNIKKIFFLGFILLTPFFITNHLWAAGSAHLTWNANTESDLAGYKVYYDVASRSGSCPSGYAQSLSVENVTSKWIDDLTPGQTYYFQLTAKDTSNNESTCSISPGEVSKLVTYRGDINSTPDRKVNINDFTLFAADYGRTSFCGPVNKADINRDCVVNINDFTLLAEDYGKSF